MVDFLSQVDIKDPYFAALSSEEILLKTKGKASTMHAYMELRSRSWIPWTKESKQIWSKYVYQAQQHLERAFPQIEQLKTPWKIAQLDQSIEFGYSYTLQNVIFLSSSLVATPPKDAVLLLAHERMHIFQRLHPEVFHTLYRAKGWVSIPAPTIPTQNILLTNPDALDWWEFEGKIPFLIWDGKPALRALDISTQEITSTQLQHPNEELAYAIESSF